MNIPLPKSLERAIIGVRNNPMPLKQKQHEAFVEVLAVAGLNADNLALLLDRDKAELVNVIKGDVPVTGEFLAEACTLMGLNPKIPQQTVHFSDGAKRQGKERWKGPDKALVTGHAKTGQNFAECWDQSGRGCSLDHQKIGLIKSGRAPIPLDALRCVVTKLRKHKERPQHFEFLVGIVEAVPKGFRTYEEIVQLIETQKSGAKEMETSIEWGESIVIIDGETYSTQPGPHMARVATRIRALKQRDKGDSTIGTILNLNLPKGQEPYSTNRSKILSAMENGNETLPREVLEGVVEYFGIPIEALFTGDGLRIPDPCQNADGGDSVAVNDDTWARDWLFDRGRVTLQDGVDPFDLVELSGRKEDPAVDWVAEFIRLTKQGESLQQLVDKTAETAKGMGPDATQAFLRMLSHKLSTKGDE